MSDKKVTVRGLDGDLFREGDVPIYVLTDGRFAVHLGDKWEVRASLKGIDKLLNVGRPSLKIMSVPGSFTVYSYDTKVLDASDFQRSQIKDKEGKRVHLGYGDWVVFDATKHEQLLSLLAHIDVAQRGFNEELRQIIKGTKKVYTGNFKELLARQERGEAPDIFEEEE